MSGAEKGLDASWRQVLGAPWQPGQGRTPPRNALAAVRAEIVAPVALAALPAHPAFCLAADLTAAGYHWEAHELLEGLWLAATPNSRERFLLQGLIQQANAQMKRAMGQVRAAERIERDGQRWLRESGLADLAPSLDQSARHAGVPPTA